MARACGADADARREVLSLLEAHDAAGTFLEHAPAVPGAADTASVLANRTLGPYHVEAELGRGGMGIVYLALDTRLGRLVALKVIAPDVVDDERRRAWLQREARAAATLSHPGIATVYAREDIAG